MKIHEYQAKAILAQYHVPVPRGHVAYTVEEAEAAAEPERPTCPRCGWHNTRLSHTKDMFDGILRTFSLRAFRCRSCGNRFRRFRRVPKA